MNCKILLCLALILSGNLNAAEGQTNSNLRWATYTEAKRHFHFRYPATWKISTDLVSVMHYRDVFVSLNSAKRPRVADLQVSTNAKRYGPRETIQQMPAGSVYMDVGYLDGPWPRWGPRIHEMKAADLSGVLKTAKEMETDGLITRQIEFHKWGRHWSIVVYMRQPISAERSHLMEQVLKSFHFDGVPAGDKIWAIGLARQQLPPEADPDQFTREGGSSVYYNATLKDGNDVLVMFTKHFESQPEKTWSYRVTETGEVRPLDGKVMAVGDSSPYHGAMAEVMPQFDRAPAVATTSRLVTSAREGLPEIQKVANRPIVAVTEYTNWFWYSSDGFISGYAVQDGGSNIFKWNLWSR